MSAFANVLTSLPPIKCDPHAVENAEITRGWLAALRDGSHTESEFDAQIAPYHVLQFCVVCGVKDEYFPDMMAQIDRRMHLRGLRYCRWRGWVPVGQFDQYRNDRAAERAAAPGKFDRAA